MKMKEPDANITFFYHAIIAYSETGQPEVLEAIKTAVICGDEIINKKQRNEIAKLNSSLNKTFHQHSIPGHDYAIHHATMNRRLSEIEDFFQNRTYSSEEIELQKERLKTRSLEYYDALIKSDRLIFINKFPKIFERHRK